MSYELATGSSGTDFSLTDSVTIRSVEIRMFFCCDELMELKLFSFGNDSILFQCRYSRSVSVSQDMTITETPVAVEGTGDLSYSMSINVGGPGGSTDVTITPNHNFGQIAPR